MRILIFHGYLLSGTGSNVYNARLAEALVRLGHEVHLLSQDRHPERQRFVDAVGEWREGSLSLSPVGGSALAHADREAAGAQTAGEDGNRSASDAPRAGSGGQPRGRGRCIVYRPQLDGLLPVYVLDRYEGIQARSFLECSDAEIAGYVEANVRAVRAVCERARPQLALANHLVMGPAILARALRGEVPYAVKVHGSALEYTVKRDPARFLPYAREGLASASAVLVGSRHTALSLWEAMEDPALERRTRLGPPGVDVRRFAPRPPTQAAAGLAALEERLRSQARAAEPVGAEGSKAPARPQAGAEASTFARDELAAAAAIERLAGGSGPLVAFVGKLIPGKGVDLLLAAWPLVLQRQPTARLALVGFGSWREHLEGLLDALATGDLESARRGALPYLGSFLDRLGESERERYRTAAARLPEHVVLTGRLDHEELADLLPACQALVVPSTFPEAFGMVAAEAAACGALPVSARHSGLAEVSDVLARALPEPAAGWLSFPADGSAVNGIAQRLIDWLAAEPRLREDVRARLVEVARERWSWEGVASGVICAAQGQLGTLEVPR